MSNHLPARRTLAMVVVGMAAIFAMTHATVAQAATYSGTAENGFTGPVGLGPASAGLGEPSLAIDSSGRLFVTAPQAIGNIQTAGGSPLFRSTDGGATWQGPVRSQLCTGFSGGDTDLALDGGQNLYQTDLWLGNSCISVSEDHGQTYTAGNPFGSHLQPGDDRPWLAYSASENEVFTTYDGLTALRVSNTAPLADPSVGIQAINDQVAVQECLLNGCGTPPLPPTTRECVCPPGGIAVDNSSSGPHSHPGRVYVSFSRQNGASSGGGVGIAYSDPVAGQANTPGSWVQPGRLPGIPGTGSTGSAFDTEWNFDPIKVDSNGTLYVMWGEQDNVAKPGAGGAIGGVDIKFASSTDGGSTWNGPFLISTTTSTNVFPTMDVAGPGKLDFAYYGAPELGSIDPNFTSATQSWNVYYATATNADTALPTLSTPAVAIQGMHTGCIQVGGGGGCSDRSLLDFFQLTTDPCGNPNIIYTSGDATNGVALYFTKLASTSCSTTPQPQPQPQPVIAETPWAPLLVISGMALTAIGVRRRRRAPLGTP